LGNPAAALFFAAAAPLAAAPPATTAAAPTLPLELPERLPVTLFALAEFVALLLVDASAVEADDDDADDEGFSAIVDENA
jgi:hypothetical protein